MAKAKNHSERPLEYDVGVTPGDADLPGLDEALAGKSKLRITTMVDEDIYDELKRRSGKKGYQTLLNKILREALFGMQEDSPLVKWVQELKAEVREQKLIVKEVTSRMTAMDRRMAKLAGKSEKPLLKKKAG